MYRKQNVKCTDVTNRIYTHFPAPAATPFCSTVQLGLSVWPRELDYQYNWPWSWRLSHSSDTFYILVGRHLQLTIFLCNSSSRRHSTWGKPFSMLFITDLNTASPVERSLTAAISHLACVSNARVLTKSFKIDQLESITDLTTAS